MAGSVAPHQGGHLHYEERTSPFRFGKVARKPALSRGPGPGTTVPVGTVRVSRLHFGVKDSNSVRRLQDVLNGLSMSGRLLEVTGDYDSPTRRLVKVWQLRVASDPPAFVAWAVTVFRDARSTGSSLGRAMWRSLRLTVRVVFELLVSDHVIPRV